jgi:hypothetical protein
MNRDATIVFAPTWLAPGRIRLAFNLLEKLELRYPLAVEYHDLSIEQQS